MYRLPVINIEVPDSQQRNKCQGQSCTHESPTVRGWMGRTLRVSGLRVRGFTYWAASTNCPDDWLHLRSGLKYRIEEIKFRSASLRLEALLSKRCGAVRDLHEVRAVLTSRRFGWHVERTAAEFVRCTSAWHERRPLAWVIHDKVTSLLPTVLLCRYYSDMLRPETIMPSSGVVRRLEL